MKESGFERTTFKLALEKSIRLYVSKDIIAEYAEVLERLYLEISKGLRLSMLQLISNSSHLIAPSRTLDVCKDPDDNIFLECAEAARADYLITGNKKHFPPSWKHTKIVTARQFVEMSAPNLIR